MDRSTSEADARDPQRHEAAVEDEGAEQREVDREQGLRLAWTSFRMQWSMAVLAWCRKDPRLRSDPHSNAWDVLVDVFDACYLQGDGAVTEQHLRRATNRLSSERRRQERHEMALEESDAFPQRSSRPSRTADASLRIREWLRPPLEMLPVSKRIAIERHYLEGVSDREIAREIGCAVATVRVIRARGMEAVRRLASESPPPN